MKLSSKDWQELASIFGPPVFTLLVLLVLWWSMKPQEDKWTAIEVERQKSAGCLRLWIDDELKQEIGCDR